MNMSQAASNLLHPSHDAKLQAYEAEMIWREVVIDERRKNELANKIGCRPEELLVILDAQKHAIQGQGVSEW